MARRTTHAAVVEVLGNDYSADQGRSTVPFIDTVTGLVTRVAALAAQRGFTYTSAELERMECWLAAWAYALSDKPLTQESKGRASGSYAGETGKRLEANLYGQQALTMDFSGALQALTAGKVVGGVWLGRRPSEQTDYDNRD